MSEITAWQAIPSTVRTLLVCLAACIFSLGTAYLLRFQLSAFAVFCFCLAACIIAFSRPTTAWGFFVYNFAFVFIALGLFELYLAAYTSNNHFEGTYADGTYFVDDADLGYALARRERIVKSTLKSAAGLVVYDVQYSINSYGLRKTSLKAEDAIAGKSIFFRAWS